MSEIYSRTKTGRAFNGAHRDAGTIRHAVPCKSDPSWSKSLCGTNPGYKGNGWSTPDKEKITCTKCLQILTKKERT